MYIIIEFPSGRRSEVESALIKGMYSYTAIAGDGSVERFKVPLAKSELGEFCAFLDAKGLSGAYKVIS